MDQPNQTVMTPATGNRRVVRCPHCKGAVDVGAAKAGQKVVCPLCRRKFAVAGASTPASKPSVSPSSVGAGASTMPPLKQPQAASSPVPSKQPQAASSPVPSKHTQVEQHRDSGTAAGDNTLGVVPDRTLANYKIVGFLGKGGMGQVFKGFDTTLHRHVAIKELSPHLSANDELVERFLREGRLVAKLNHEHICEIYYMGRAEDTGAPFFAMEFVDGCSLEERLRDDGKLPVDEAVTIIKQVCFALQAANTKGMIHRDIKPANIMLTLEKSVKVTDFGLAKLVEGGQSLTATDVIMGTPHYMSPEAGQGIKCDLRTDIYSLGVTFYHILTGKVPFDGPSALAVLHKQINEPLPVLQVLRQEVPKSLSAIIRRMTLKQPADRYGNYEELLADLAAFSKGEVPVGGASGIRVPAISGEHIKIAAEAARSAATKAASQAAKTLAPKISIRRRWKIKLALSPVILLFAWLFFYGQSGMVYVPAGVYKVGPTGQLFDAKLDGFWIDRYEVTRAAYAKACQHSAPTAEFANHPMLIQTEAEVKAYLDATGYELPTDEQWQAAARGSHGAPFPWGTDITVTAGVNLRVLGSKDTASVGTHSLDKGHFGCYDMCGNVRECTAGDMGGSYRGNETVNGILGGSYSTRLSGGNCSIRPSGYRSISIYGSDLGFRCVRNDGFFLNVREWSKLAIVLLFVVALCLFL